MILSHLARFLALLVCLTPRAWKIENMLLCSPRLLVSLCLYVCNSYKHLHKNICLHTKIYLCVCVGVVAPKCLLFAFKKKQPNCCSCHLRTYQQHCLPVPGFSLLD